MARVSLPTPTLRTARLRLRPFGDADADALFALHSSGYVLRYWVAPPWSERARAERFIAACRQMADEGTGARLAMDRVSGGAFIGWCSLTRWNPDYRSASLGYCLNDAAWGHGYATEAARLAAVGVRHAGLESSPGRDRYAQRGICPRPGEDRIRGKTAS
jgi:ribosomal-protein-alanine N-acetyltransferase